MWFSLYMLLIQFVDMHLLFLFSFFWLLLSFAIFNTMWWTFCLVQGKKKKNMRYFCYSVLWKNIWRPFEWDLYQHKKQATKNKQKQQSEPNGRSQQSRNRRNFSNPCRRRRRLYVWHMYETHGSDLDHQEHLLLSPLSSLLPSPAFLFLLPPRRDGRAERHPGDTHNRPSCLHKSLEWTDSGCHARKKTPRDRFFFLLSSPQKHKKDSLNSHFLHCLSNITEASCNDAF